MAHERLKPAYTFDEDRLKQLRQIAPEAFADGKINWETLKESLGEYLENEESEEHFGLFWPGKREARRLASIPSTGTLVPVYGEGLKAGGTPDDDGKNDSRNIFIEGENLEVLKILQKSYAGKIKMIYIDPPYNTGNDFVYDDNFTEPLQEYLRRTGQVDEEGRTLTTNKQSDGRFHSNWLSMMYPRLRLARNLLKDDGVIFVSIDDNESANLNLILNEIFGEENFRAQISWQKKYSVSNNFKGIASIRDIIYVYSKSESFENGFIPRTEESRSRYINPDDDPRGPWKPVDYWNQASPDQRPNLVYEIVNPNTSNVIVPEKKAWKYSKEVHEEHVRQNKIWWGSKGENTVPALKLFLSEVRDGLIPNNWWPHQDAGHTDEAKKELEELFPEGAPFDTPKPIRLIERMMVVAGVKSGDIFLDFFGGSGSTGHAIFKKNVEEESEIRFVIVQMPEGVEQKSNANKLGLFNISKICGERLRRASQKYNSTQREERKIDIGFKTFSLYHSHYKSWQNYNGQDVFQLETLFSKFENPLIDNWTEEGLLTEVMLLEGFPLDSQIEKLPEYSTNKIHKVSSDFHEHSLLVCLDDKIQAATIQQLDLKGNDVFICLDQAINDQDKLRLSDKGVIKTI